MITPTKILVQLLPEDSSGIVALVVSNKWHYNSDGVGWGNGYIVIPPTHPWFNTKVQIIDAGYDREVTYSNVLSQDEECEFYQVSTDHKGWRILGFDTNCIVGDAYTEVTVKVMAELFRQQAKLAYYE